MDFRFLVYDFMQIALIALPIHFNTGLIAPA